MSPRPPLRECTVGYSNLNVLQGSGIPCTSVTELASESGCGKTQLCLQLLLCARLLESQGGLSSASLCLFSKPPFPLSRLQSFSLSLDTNRVDSLLLNPPVFDSDRADRDQLDRGPVLL
ncbi:hypothetical protein QJS04_geneDACA000696 [Acorus gramineus]|uniref:Rad51-like C-terminal domain-containing protein n=1 Tax=Acorus gramineus TaxID=55184 RepID=A0AAV9ASV4_ACOGR|nr:hypothetical protein QJS04_geneDACA000696 [Acorus gramineus]